MRRGVGERHALVLGGDVAQVGGDGRELGRGAEATVDVRPAAELLAALHHPAHDELLLGGDARGLEPGQGPRAGGDLEQGLDLGLVGPRAEQLGPGPAAQDEREGVDQHRLSGPRLTGKYVESWRKFQREALDEGDVPDAQVRQHAAEPRGCPRQLHALARADFAHAPNVRSSLTDSAGLH